MSKGINVLKLVEEIELRQDGDIILMRKDLTAKAYSESIPFLAPQIQPRLGSNVATFIKEYPLWFSSFVLKAWQKPALTPSTIVFGLSDRYAL